MNICIIDLSILSKVGYGLSVELKRIIFLKYMDFI